VAAAFSASRQGYEAGPLFWAGFAVIVVPIFALLWGRWLTRTERLGLLVILGLALYFIKVLHDPVQFTFFDELLHLRTAEDIMETGALFRENPLLPVSPAYPGLEIVTTAFGSMSGLSIFASAVIVVGAARVLMMLALFLFFIRIGATDRIAGLGVAVYAGSPGFVFFDSQFAYESLAIPLAVVALLLVARLSEPTESGRITTALVLVLAALVVTHHATSYALLALLGLWALVAGAQRTRDLIARASRYRTLAPIRGAVLFLRGSVAVVRRGTHSEIMAPLFASAALAAMIVFWFLLVARDTLPYLGPIVGSRIEEFLLVITGGSTTRAAFQTYTGETPPAFESGLTFLAAALISLGILGGLLVLLRGRRAPAATYALAGMAVFIPFSMALRVVDTLTEVTNRFANFAFIGVGLVVALAVVWLLSQQRVKQVAPPLVLASLTVIAIGGIQIGWGPTFRIMPGGYRVAADSQSIEPHGVAAARWARENLGPNNRLTADRMNWLLMGSYGGQEAVTKTKDGVVLAPAYFSPTLGVDERWLLLEGEIEYLVVDRRLNRELPVVGVYFENGEPNSFRHRFPIALTSLNKFERVPEISKVYDNGSIAIYDIRDLHWSP
jgi:hypothetical protein